MSEPQTVLITGASSGFGELAATTLLGAGHTVVATMRDPDGRNRDGADRLRQAASSAPGAVHIVELDVIDEASVERAIDRALELVGAIDVVVNNAGFGGGGHLEGFTPDQFHQMFDVNVYGVQRVTRAVLPGMRQRGRGVVLPFCGPYTASKAALESMSESYRYELAGTGVEVTILQPGGFGTAFMESMASPDDVERITGYGELADLPDKMWSGFLENLTSESAPDPQEVADAILELVETPPGQRPPRRLVDPLMGGMGVPVINQTTAATQRELLTHIGMTHMADVTG
jgi:NAD(P)-dependent dehydrogenase (short-subunit alcohol dehydrogenase family)